MGFSKTARELLREASGRSYETVIVKGPRDTIVNGRTVHHDLTQRDDAAKALVKERYLKVIFTGKCR